MMIRLVAVCVMICDDDMLRCVNGAGMIYAMLCLRCAWAMMTTMIYLFVRRCDDDVSVVNLFVSDNDDDDDDPHNVYAMCAMICRERCDGVRQADEFINI